MLKKIIFSFCFILFTGGAFAQNKPQKNELKANGNLLDRSTYDALGIAFSGKYKLKSNNAIQAGLHYSFLAQDTNADAFYAMDEVQNFSKLSTSIKYIGSF